MNYDQENARNLVSGFVAAYNKLVDTIAEVTRYNVEAREAAPLLGDPAVRAIRDGLRREIAGNLPAAAGDTFSSLAMIGITTENDGKLKVDATNSVTPSKPTSTPSGGCSRATAAWRAVSTASPKAPWRAAGVSPSARAT